MCDKHKSGRRTCTGAVVVVWEDGSGSGKGRGNGSGNTNSEGMVDDGCMERRGAASGSGTGGEGGAGERAETECVASKEKWFVDR